MSKTTGRTYPILFPNLGRFLPFCFLNSNQIQCLNNLREDYCQKRVDFLLNTKEKKINSLNSTNIPTNSCSLIHSFAIREQTCKILYITEIVFHN